MRNRQTKRDLFFLTAILITAANVMLVWAFRFLPLYDYPIWLYEVRIMRAIADPLFASAFENVPAPVPNLGLVGPIWLLSFLMPLEVAGKSFLTLSVMGLPWSFRYCVSALSPVKESWAEYVGFPFSFCVYFFSGQAFLFGIMLLLLCTGYFLPRLNHPRRHYWLLLSCALLGLYFVHAIIVLLMFLVFVSAILTLESKLRPTISLLFASVPTLICLIMYALSFSTPETAEGRWSLWILAQNVFKPLFIFTRSYGHSTSVPLSLLNVAWLCGVGYILTRAYLSARTEGALDKRFALPIGVALVLMLVLPGYFLGIVQAGSRFGLPLLLFAVLMTSRAHLRDAAKLFFLASATTVIVYNVFHFKRVDQQMTALYADLEIIVASRAPFGVTRFDWPADRSLRDIASTSIDPLYGSIYYLQLQRNGIGAIFGTSLLRVRDEFVYLKPTFGGRTREEFTAAAIRQKERFNGFRYLVLVGKNDELDMFATTMSQSGFHTVKRREYWTVLESDAAQAPTNGNADDTN